MGIAVQELLAMEYFKDFYVIAGRKGLYKEVQGITLFEAPDGTRWSQGRELILSSGYVIAMEPGCIRQSFKEGGLRGAAAMMIKRGRHLDKIPEEIIELFEYYEIPLISMPFSVPWMELMSQINTAVMNRTIRRFRIHAGSTLQLSNQSYKVQKIKRILQAVEAEMRFPAFLYDLEENQGYYSSANFKTVTQSFGLSESDYWNPSQLHTRHILCDYINMARYRLINQDNSDSPRVSWITIPIVMDQVTQAYFVVMESREFIDYYDEYSIRIAFLVLQGVYEQIMVVRNAGNVGFENFIHFALNYNEEDSKKLIYQANIQGISMSTEYIYTVFRQHGGETNARGERKSFSEAFKQSSIGKTGRIAFLDENEGLILIDAKEAGGMSDEQLKGGFEEFAGYVADRCEGMELTFGICREAKNLTEINSCVEKCRKVLKMGRTICPQESVWSYEMLGPLTWLQIPEEELKSMLEEYRVLMEDSKNLEILRTLKLYLENNMNYSVTAEKMYVHINTVRKRIEKANELISVEWDSYIDRLKTELLLQFLDLQQDAD